MEEEGGLEKIWIASLRDWNLEGYYFAFFEEEAHGPTLQSWRMCCKITNESQQLAQTLHLRPDASDDLSSFIIFLNSDDFSFNKFVIPGPYLIALLLHFYH
jgi:hypothetical protein